MDNIKFSKPVPPPVFAMLKAIKERMEELNILLEKERTREEYALGKYSLARSNYITNQAIFNALIKQYL